jgi:2-polyprenyl-6-methoxyphenol hydroxylase-like FAD-dependent oxidoreductase
MSYVYKLHAKKFPSYCIWTMLEDVVIVGGGPAGAYLAYLLAQIGIFVTILDHSHPGEKPCGGAISPLAVRKYPILKGVPHSRFIDKIMVVSPKGREVMLYVPTESGMVVSRGLGSTSTMRWRQENSALMNWLQGYIP